MNFLIASNNLNKINEIKNIVFDHNFISIKDKKINSNPVKIGKSFSENAYIKAKKVFDITNYSCIADDSGVEIKCMNNFPGIYSARHNNKTCNNDYERNLFILDKMKMKLDRKARLTCCISLILSKNRKYFFYGYCYGQIAWQIKGTNGFGYDSIFCPDGYNKTLSELNSEVKNKISHRYNALLKLRMFLYEKK